MRYVLLVTAIHDSMTSRYGLVRAVDLLLRNQESGRTAHLRSVKLHRQQGKGLRGLVWIAAKPL
jgi:hypothetical protein